MHCALSFNYFVFWFSFHHSWGYSHVSAYNGEVSKNDGTKKRNEKSKKETRETSTYLVLISNLHWRYSPCSSLYFLHPPLPLFTFHPVFFQRFSYVSTHHPLLIYSSIYPPSFSTSIHIPNFPYVHYHSSSSFIISSFHFFFRTEENTSVG